KPCVAHRLNEKPIRLFAGLLGTEAVRGVKVRGVDLVYRTNCVLSTAGDGGEEGCRRPSPSAGPPAVLGSCASLRRSLRGTPPLRSRSRRRGRRPRRPGYPAPR